MPTKALHHAAICTSDVEAALRFWQDGMGLSQVFDITFAGQWRELFGASSDDLRSIFLNDPDRPEAGLVELVIFEDSAAEEPLLTAPRHGFFLLSFERDVESTLERLAGLGFGADLRRIAQPVGDGRHVAMAVLSAPDGVLIELVGSPR
jgi:glyoxylase I family protein